ncbi:MAG TPA: amino acid permease [Sphingomicrobium sp.]|nr:amino acid permease [Sphingomicrobium sp.]
MAVTEAGPGGLVRRLGVFDATMLVMGGIIGSGIFVTPAEVARHVSTPLLIVGVWVIGGVIALAASFVYAELAARRPEVGGQYAYLRDAYGPVPAFLYGWALLLVIQSGGMAAVAITFARYFGDLVHLPLADSVVAVVVLALLTVINCLGVRSGSNVQSGLMLLKILAIAGLVLAGLTLAPTSPGEPTSEYAGSVSTLAAIGAAMTPVMFSYGGWQTASFVAGEMRNPGRDLGRGLLFGVAGVVLLYTLVAFVCVHGLGPAGLASSKTPATDVMRLALGSRGATFIGLGIAISALGFLSQGMLTAPRVYFAMAEDGLFFRSVAAVSSNTHVPVVAIILQGFAAAVIALSGTFGQILGYVVSVDFIFFALTGAALFVFRRRDGDRPVVFKVPLHPFTTGLFVIACVLTVIATVWNNLANSLIGYAILLAGVPACLYWQRKSRTAAA